MILFMDKLNKYKSAGLKSGLLGGSFDPPHEGHFFITKDALKRFGLDCVWWIVAKKNTLKENKPRDFNERITWCENLIKNEPNILVLDIEKNIKSHDTVDVLSSIKKNYDNEYFWIMGSDSFFTFDQWPEWEKILKLVKIIVYDRPSFLFESNKERINAKLKKHQKTFTEFQCVATSAWTLIKADTPNISSTELRENIRK